MKKFIVGAAASAVLLGTLVTTVFAAKPLKPECNTITKGEILYSATHYLAGESIPTGYDAYGYNYQAHLFNGTYANSYLGGEGFPAYEGSAEDYEEAYPTEYAAARLKWYWPYRDVNLSMKWNDAWISNKDCGIDGIGGFPDGKLDRHFGFVSYIGSGAWLTNHQSENGETYNWNYFTKIVAAPADATLPDEIWYNADGTEIGPVIWGQFATILSVYNDQETGDHGVEYLSPAGPGFGKY